MLNLNPAAALEKARAGLAACEAKIDRLVGERTLALASDDLAPVLALDRAIEAERQAAGIHRDRIGLLEAATRRQDWARRERERLAAIETVILPNVRKCEALGRELETTLAKFCDAWSALIEEVRVINADWPVAVPRPPAYAYFSVHDALNLVVQALQSRKNEWGYPVSVDAERVAQLARRVGPITPAVERAGAAFLERIRGMKIPEPDGGSSAEAAA